MKNLLRVIVLLGLLLALVPGATAQHQAPEMVTVLVTFKERPADMAEAGRALAASARGQVKTAFTCIPTIVVTVPQNALGALEKNPQVLRVTPVQKYEWTDTELQDSWGVRRVYADAAWASTATGDGVKVAVLDTGVDYTHPDLAPNYAGGIDIYDNDNDPMDGYGHGTHVAGIIAAADNDSNPGVVGVAPEASLYAVKLCCDEGYGLDTVYIIAGIQWCITNEMDVINMSLSGPYSQDLCDAVTAAANAGIAVVSAAGNSGPGENSVGCPANCTNSMAVGATNDTDTICSFSSRGAQVDIAAPGRYVLSCKTGGGYIKYSGTSMASPHVAGAVALFYEDNPNITPAQARAKCTDYATDLGPAGWDSAYGWGLLNVWESFQLDPAYEMTMHDLDLPSWANPGEYFAYSAHYENLGSQTVKFELGLHDISNGGACLDQTTLHSGAGQDAYRYDTARINAPGWHQVEAQMYNSRTAQNVPVTEQSDANNDQYQWICIVGSDPSYVHDLEIKLLVEYHGHGGVPITPPDVVYPGWWRVQVFRGTDNVMVYDQSHYVEPEGFWHTRHTFGLQVTTNGPQPFFYVKLYNPQFWTDFPDGDRTYNQCAAAYFYYGLDHPLTTEYDGDDQTYKVTFWQKVPQWLVQQRNLDADAYPGYPGEMAVLPGMADGSIPPTINTSNLVAKNRYDAEVDYGLWPTSDVTTEMYCGHVTPTSEECVPSQLSGRYDSYFCQYSELRWVVATGGASNGQGWEHRNWAAPNCSYVDTCSACTPSSKCDQSFGRVGPVHPYPWDYVVANVCWEDDD